MFSCETQYEKDGRILLYVKASLNPIALETKIIDNVDVIFLQLKTYSKIIII